LKEMKEGLSNPVFCAQIKADAENRKLIWEKNPYAWKLSADACGADCEIGEWPSFLLKYRRPDSAVFAYTVSTLHEKKILAVYYRAGARLGFLVSFDPQEPVLKMYNYREIYRKSGIIIMSY
jgi:hypothetical protein